MTDSVDSKSIKPKGTINQLDLTDIHRTLDPTIAEYTFFQNSHGLFTKIEHNLGYKTHLNKCFLKKRKKRKEIRQRMLGCPNRIKLEVSNRKTSGKPQNLEIKQHTSKQQMCQISSLERNFKIF